MMRCKYAAEAARVLGFLKAGGGAAAQPENTKEEAGEETEHERPDGEDEMSVEKRTEGELEEGKNTDMENLDKEGHP